MSQYVPRALHPCAVAASFVAKQFRPSDIIQALCLHRKPSSCLLRKELGREKEMGTICLLRAGKMGLKKVCRGYITVNCTTRKFKDKDIFHGQPRSHPQSQQQHRNRHILTVVNPTYHITCQCQYSRAAGSADAGWRPRSAQGPWASAERGAQGWGC